MFVLLDVPHWPENAAVIENVNVQVVFSSKAIGIKLAEGSARWHIIAETIGEIRNRLNEAAPKKRKESE